MLVTINHKVALLHAPREQMMSVTTDVEIQNNRTLANRVEEISELRN